VAPPAALATAGTQSGSEGLTGWIERQYALSAAAMLSAISATHLVKVRAPFAQTVRPARGSILASTRLGSWDPDPDYFFHWLRDSAIVIDALRPLLVERAPGGAAAHCTDFVAFSLTLNDLDGDRFLRAAGDFRKKIDPGYLQYVREDASLAHIRGERVLGEPRFNPDGTFDILKWSRPQHDGPALRAVALMRLWPLDAFDDDARASMRKLLLADLRFVFRNWREPCFDMWEEELGHHYATRLLDHAALADGARWMEETQAATREEAQSLRATSEEILTSLDEYWDGEKGHYVSRRGVANGEGGKELDFAVILGVLHAGRKSGAHSIFDPKAQATLRRLEDLFDEIYEINRNRPEGRAPAIGRYAGDKYFSGGAYYFSTLGAAEFYYALAAEIAQGAELTSGPNSRFLASAELTAAPGEAESRRQSNFKACLRKGDAFMATVAAFTPASGELSEQFDQKTGAQSSAKMLAWSHAAFITAAARRRAAIQRFDNHPGSPAQCLDRKT